MRMSGNNRNNNAAAVAPSTTNASASAGNTGTAAQDPINGQPIATRQLQDRAITILENNQLIMRYAVANNLVSTARRCNPCVCSYAMDVVRATTYVFAWSGDIPCAFSSDAVMELC